MRRRLLEDLGASPAEADELLAYGENHFDAGRPAHIPSFPLEDEAHVAVWEEYAAEAGGSNVLEALRRRLPQCAFAVRAGVSETEAYRAATRRGEAPEGPDATGLLLERPEGLRLILHETPAGRIPVLVPKGRADFVALIRAFLHRNEPAAIPDSQGATMVGGFNNWDRVRRLRERFEEENPGGDWGTEFSRIVPEKHLYQDRFIILSDGPYSGVPAAEVGLDEAAWREASWKIRLDHECAHYVTKRVLGSMKNRMHDEVVADYCGIVSATGRYRTNWFLRFVGLDDFPRYRDGARLENYRGDPPLSEGAFCVLQTLVHRAATNLGGFDAAYGEACRSLSGRARVLLALTAVTLEEMASEDGIERIEHAFGAAV